MGRKKRANSISRTTKNKKITEKTVSPTYDVDDDHKYTDPPKAHSITIAVTQSVLGELKRAGIHSNMFKTKHIQDVKLTILIQLKKNKQRCEKKRQVLSTGRYW